LYSEDLGSIGKNAVRNVGRYHCVVDVGEGRSERGGTICPSAGELVLKLETWLLVHPIRIPRDKNLRKVVLKGLQNGSEPESTPTQDYSLKSKARP